MLDKGNKVDEMNGATSVVKTLLASGIDTCFANPGTSEMHFVAALDQVSGMRCVLGLQENVVTGMADGYYRIAGKPACTLLHCGPGLANGLANLHNARRARSGVVNIVGDQATYHRPYDAPLTADTESLARAVSSWVHTSTDTSELGKDTAKAVHSAAGFPGQVATLILPANVSWQQGGSISAPMPLTASTAIDSAAIEAAARTLTSHSDTLILVGGPAVLQESQKLLWRISQATGAPVMAEYVLAKVARGRGRLPLERVPYATAQAIKALEKYKHIILVNAQPPVGFFAYPGLPSVQHAPDAQFHVLTRVDQNPVEALQALTMTLKAPQVELPVPGLHTNIVRGTPSPEGLAQTLAAVMPENAIISDESVSYGRGFYKFTHVAPSHDWLHITGGAIGQGMPVATGAAIGAGSQRRVINLQADGSAMYTLQSLWTQGREKLPITTIILNNSKYNILIGEYKNVGAVPGTTAMNMLDLGNPCLNWVQLANGMGVEAARAETLEQCADLMRFSFVHERPFLIELMI